ncbi:hypothetical protein N7508_010674 [Penicillium antarcticum]|uniref:uncharacterized protein n=1 Tax=Penicillium antarcticum TaxID=416450 RepID=UPI002386FB8C|nr:uncharacterized protein N7508_010674 [Penicillium antarcticum]KAJ5295853.1 hypothetical protein N7508_010674 [Penicillium antarcticum]
MSSKSHAVEADIHPSTLAQKESKRKWVSYIWDTFDKSPEERRLMSKLDSAILTFASLGYFIKYLDQIKLTVRLFLGCREIPLLSRFHLLFILTIGRKEDLGMYGNQLNYMQTCWTIGYVIGEIPSNLLLTRIKPRYWIPAMELLWTVLTMSLPRCSKPTQFYVLRFFVGLAESTFYPGMQYIIGSWYRKDELAKRSCIFHTSSGIASMFSGYLMDAVYNLGGRGGFKGWQWLFIVDGIISLPVAISGFFILPDVPEISSPWYLSQEVTISRHAGSQTGPKTNETRGKKRQRTIHEIKAEEDIHFMAHLPSDILYICFNNGATGSQPIFQQYLKSSTDPVYTISQINSIPTTTPAVQVVTTLAYAWISDSILNGSRWPPIIFGACINIISYISLAVWDIPTGWKWTCYIISGAGYGLSGLLMAWAHEICSEDNEERSLVIGSMNEMAYVFQAWLPLVVWQQVDAPQYRKGFIAITVLSVLLIGTTLLIRNLHRRERVQKRLVVCWILYVVSCGTSRLTCFGSTNEAHEAEETEEDSVGVMSLDANGIKA